MQILLTNMGYVNSTGHNWGAEHDAETSECAPSAFDNGKYLMYPYAVSGFDENNNVSKILTHLKTAVATHRALNCFHNESSPVQSRSWFFIV